MSEEEKDELELQDVRLLLVDDEPSIIATLVRMFRPQGYTLFTASSGREGLELLEQEEVDLVISDMRMPEMDGATFLAEVTARWPDVVGILLTGYSDIESTAKAINKGHIYAYFSKPWERKKLLESVAEGVAKRRKKLATRQQQAETEEENLVLHDQNEELEAAVAARTEELQQTNMFLESAYAQIKRAYMDTVEMFAQLIERFEGSQAGHSRKVAEWALDVARAMGLDGSTLDDIRAAALLHDIGKIGIPEKVLIKSQHEYEAEDYDRMREHPLQGEAILMSMEPLQRAARLIRHHHESFDGTGYPDGLKGEAIPLGSRIIGVCDYFDRLMGGYHTTEKMGLADALEVLKLVKGVKLDPDIVDQFINMMKDAGASGRYRQELVLATSALEPGMVLSRTLHSSRQVPLIVSGKQLTTDLIEKLWSYESDSGEQFVVHVYKDEY